MTVVTGCPALRSSDGHLPWTRRHPGGVRSRPRCRLLAPSALPGEGDTRVVCIVARPVPCVAAGAGTYRARACPATTSPTFCGPPGSGGRRHPQRPVRCRSESPASRFLGTPGTRPRVPTLLARVPLRPCRAAPHRSQRPVRVLSGGVRARRPSAARPAPPPSQAPSRALETSLRSGRPLTVRASLRRPQGSPGHGAVQAAGCPAPRPCRASPTSPTDERPLRAAHAVSKPVAPHQRAGGSSRGCPPAKTTRNGRCRRCVARCRTSVQRLAPRDAPGEGGRGGQACLASHGAAAPRCALP